MIAPQLDLEFCRSEAERRFAIALNGRAERDKWFADSWLSDDGLTITITIIDDGCIIRTLRADFDGDSLVLGSGEENSMVILLDSKKDDVRVECNSTPEELADKAADWFMSEMNRGIQRREWSGFKEWVLKDNGHALVQMGSKSKKIGPPIKSVDVQT